MTSVGKLIRRFVGILVLSMFLLFVVNVVILLAVASTQTPGIGPWTTAQETEAGLQKTETGYTLSAEMTKMLEDKDAWAVYIDNDTRKVLWHTENLPSEIPMQYTITDISSLTRGYLADYPTYTAGSENGLVVVGFPKDRYWKHMSPSWDYDFIRNSPYILCDCKHKAAPFCEAYRGRDPGAADEGASVCEGEGAFVGSGKRYQPDSGYPSVPEKRPEEKGSCEG